MLGLEQQELESLKRQHESKSSELAETQHRLLEERSELDRIISDVQRKDSDLSKVKQVSGLVPSWMRKFIDICTHLTQFLVCFFLKTSR